MHSPVSRLHWQTDSSWLPLTTDVSSSTTAVTSPWWPRSTRTTPPVATSHSRTDRSSLPLTHLPNVSEALTAFTPYSCPASVALHSPALLHTRSALSPLPPAERSPPSRRAANAFTGAVCPA
eukprot:1666203-Prymnesium_polylepis.1